MCNHCKIIVTSDEYYDDYLCNKQFYIAYCKEAHTFELWTHEHSMYCVITYCPWCGRKLEEKIDPYEKCKPGLGLVKKSPSEDESDPPESLKDEVYRLEGDLNHTNQVIKDLCNTLADYAKGSLNRYIASDRIKAHGAKL